MLFVYFRAYAAYEEGVEVCPEIEHDDRKRLVEYSNKLKFNGDQGLPI